jgi:hypothetical protein
LNSGPPTWASPPALFCDGFFSRWGLVKYLPGLDLNNNHPESLGLQAWATCTLPIFYLIFVKKELSSLNCLFAIFQCRSLNYFIE